MKCLATAPCLLALAAAGLLGCGPSAAQTDAGGALAPAALAAPAAQVAQVAQVAEVARVAPGAQAAAAAAGAASAPVAPVAPATAADLCRPAALAPAAVFGRTAVPELQLPVELQARELRGRPDLDAVAEGDVLLQRGALRLQAQWLSYDQAEDRARARGQVRIDHPSGQYSGSELELQLDRFFGHFLLPRYEFTRVQAGGRAQRIDFLDRERSVIEQGWYTSCPRADVVSPTGAGGSPYPDWVLQSARVQLDFEANQGIAEGAVLRFMNVPILALPTLSFPIGEGRKSGWLPPTLDFDTRSGLSVAVPYYWNIAPNRDATLTPRIITRRGPGAEGEFRYLEADYAGRVQAGLLPHDRVAGRTRWSLLAQHEGQLPLQARWSLDALRVSDDAWWKDFSNDARSLTPRLLGQRLQAERDLDFGWGRGLAYARVQRWQVLQGSDQLVLAPYQRVPQLGLELGHARAGALDYALQAEATRFDRVERAGDSGAALPTGWRAHLLASVSQRLGSDGAWLRPRLSLNAAAYALDPGLANAARHPRRVTPTASLDGGLALERQTTLLGRALRQTLEPRVLYVNTPYREHSALPNFDSAGRNIDFDSIFAENAFAGVDRVADSHQVTLGVTSRLLDAASGAEVGRLGLAQRYLLREQRVTPEGLPYTRRASDLFLLGSAAPGAGLAFDAALQYSPDIRRTLRSVASARWNPGEFRTVSATYRLTRNLAEQVELGWQWPIWKTAGGDALPAAAAGGRSGSRCGGTWYSVGRVNYSLRDSRITDSIMGLEYDAGCWIVRVVAERLSTGRSEANTRLQLQLELVGLSRLGTNPLKVLKDNIPGYRLLREEQAQPTPAPPRYD